MLEVKRMGNKNVMQVRQKGEVPFLTFPAFEKLEGIRHGFSTRLGGVSRGHLYSMNLSFTRGDDPECVKENFRRMGEAIGFSERDLVFSHQTHTTNVRVVTEEDRGNGFWHPLPYEDVDGLVTDQRGLVLTTFFADCVPLFLADPVRGVIGLSHSGWRGTVGKIGKRTVEVMKEAFGCREKDIFAAIGPSICQDCYEVSEDVIEEFQTQYRREDWDSLFYRKENGKYQLNLWRANELVFLETGILPEHISMTDVCTCCNSQILYSHRASKGKRGNLAAFLQLQ